MVMAAEAESYEKQEGGNEEKLNINKFWRAVRRKENRTGKEKGGTTLFVVVSAALCRS